MWIESEQNGILINLDNVADVIIQDGQECTVKCYTPSGFGMVVFRGSKDDCIRKVTDISMMIKATVV